MKITPRLRKRVAAKAVRIARLSALVRKGRSA